MALTGRQQAALYFARKRHRSLSHVYVVPQEVEPSESQPEPQVSPVVKPDPLKE